MSNVVNLKQPPVWELENAKTRKEYCSTRGRAVDVYQIPLSMIQQDELSQNRDTDSAPAQVSELANNLQTMGQKSGICVEAVEKREYPYAVRWGNTRFRAVNKLKDEDSEMKDCDKGHIWASIYDDSPSELRRLQAKENNLHPPATAANINDNIRSMQDIIDAGLLDKPDEDGNIERYADCSDEEKKERVRLEVEQTMPPFSGRKFKGFWNKFQKANQSSFQVQSYDTQQMKNYFIKHNPFGIGSMKDALKVNQNYVFKVKKDVHGNSLPKPENIYITFVNGLVNMGAIIQNCLRAKHKEKNACKAYTVVAVQPAKSSELNEERAKDSRISKEWIDCLPKTPFLDGSFYVPQTQPEIKAAEPWPRIEVY